MAKELFADYVKEKKTDRTWGKERVGTNFETIYVEARKKEGSSYSIGSLKTFRFGLNRYFKSTRGIEIINDVEFNEANKVFTAQCVQLKKDGQAKYNINRRYSMTTWKNCTKAAFSIQTTPRHFWTKCPSKSCCVFADVVVKIYDTWKKADFEVHTDATGAKFVSNIRDELLTKNHREDDEAEEGGVMYACGTLSLLSRNIYSI